MYDAASYEVQTVFDIRGFEWLIIIRCLDSRRLFRHTRTEQFSSSAEIRERVELSCRLTKDAPGRLMDITAVEEGGRSPTARYA